MKHLQHFGLGDSPFRNEPRPNEFFETAASVDALARLDRAVRQQKGLVVFTGDVGAGKTMVLRCLLESLEEEVYEASMLVVLNPTADSNWMLTRFARQLGVEEPASERDPLLTQVYEQLAIIREEGRHAVLLIDDAHELAATGALDEVCGLLKLEYEERRLFSLVLTGGPELANWIAAEPTLSRRVEVRVHMHPLDAAATEDYLTRRIQNVGGSPAILPDDVMEALREHGAGLPGRINTLADNALFEAYLCSRRTVSADDVARVCSDLGWSDRAATLADSAAPGRFEPRARAAAPGLGGDDLDTAFALPNEGPPKDDLDDEDLIVELIEEPA